MHRLGTCFHFTGIQNKVCPNGVKYEDVFSKGPGLRVLPCIYGNREGTPCQHYREPTPEEIQASKEQFQLAMQRIRDGVSPCCGAALDESQVIRSGYHEGHGPRFCSDCKKLAYEV